MKIKRNIYIALILILSLLGAIYRSACLLTLYDPNVGYLSSRFHSVCLAVFTVIGVVACAAAGYLFRHASFPLQPTEKGKQAWAILHAFAAALCFFGGISILSKNAIKTINYDIFIGVFSIACAAFFLLLCSQDSTKSSSFFEKTRPWAYIICIVLLFLLLCSSYFDMTVTANGPLSIPYIFAVLSCCLFFLMEMRTAIGRCIPSLHLGITSVTIFLSSSVGISRLLFALLGNTGNGVTASNPVYAAILLSVSLCAIARLMSVSIDSKMPQESADK